MYARRFIDSFCEACRECRALFDEVAWGRVWHTPFLKQGSLNHFMLWMPPPPPQTTPVLYLTATKMQLHACIGEPLRLDAAFFPEGGEMIQSCPLPILVAIEHENVIEGFRGELNKLAHVRCPLKVGITYTTTDRRGPPARLARCKRKVEANLGHILDTLSAHSHEDAKTEYLILLGDETGVYRFDWHALSFDVASGIQSAVWQQIAG